MDFLDPRKERLNRIVLFISYGLVALAITITSIILLSVTDGYCVDGKGDVDKCGLVFVASEPTNATITVNGKQQTQLTNTKLNYQSGTYDIRLNLRGYREWSHQVTVLGGDVQRLDYARLIPKELTTISLATFTNQLAVLTQSPNRRWLVVSDDPQLATIKLYDLRNSAKPAASTLTLPGGIISASEGTQSWEMVEWAENNRHILFQHNFTTGSDTNREYILLDRQAPDASRNLTKELGLVAADQLTLFHKNASQYFVYNTDTKVLRTAALTGDAPLAQQLQRVFAYKAHGDDTLLYATDAPPSGRQQTGQISVVLQQGARTTVLRQFTSPPQIYLMDIAQYKGDWFVVVGADTLKGAYIYKNPLDQKILSGAALPLAERFIKVANPTHLAFSTTAQFIMAQNAEHIGVYDTERDQVYTYRIDQIDAPQQHVRWMDGHRMVYISSGNLVMFDYDNTNKQTLQASLSSLPVSFSPDYTVVLSAQQHGAETRLSSTSLVLKR